MMKLLELVSHLPAYRLLSPPSSLAGIDISTITADSRHVTPGALFVAYRGVSLDGRRFVAAAVANGAAAVIVEEDTQSPPEPENVPTLAVPNGRQALAFLAAAWYGEPAKRLTMVGITGTDGKTTTTNILYQILAAAGKNAGMISTVNAVIGETVLETGLHTTTPDAPDVQRYLAQMVENGTEICLLETTSHGLAQHRVDACHFDIAVVTNITHEHLDIHGSLQGYRAAKARLFESLAGAAGKGVPKTAILNCDDWSFEFLKEKVAVAGVRWLGYSIAGHPEASITASHIDGRPDKTVFTVTGPSYQFEAETVLVGDYNVSNCLAATAAAIDGLDLSPATAEHGIAALPGVPGRMERLNEGQPFTAIVDFAHTPNALRRALTAARTMTAGRVIAVFGCAGQRDVAKRVLMGQIAAELADYTIITAEDPRTERLDDIITETATAMTASGGIEGQTFERQPDRGLALFKATQLAQPGDTVLALGKGHEQSMCFGTTEYPWDDRQALRSALRGQPLLTLPTVGAT